MSAGARRVLAVCARLACSEIFSRRPCDLRRAAKPYCCRRCFALSATTGKTMASAPCSGCGVVVERVASEIRRRKKLFCGVPCYQKSSDFEALGRAGGSAPHTPLAPEVMAERSRKGGFARAKALSPERLREIAMLGVAARTRADDLRAGLGKRAGKAVVLGVRLGRRS